LHCRRARESMKMDFTHADRAPADKLNVILWKDAFGSVASAEGITPPPA